ncbi:MAG: hypothetical protein D8M59_05325 [Planctomycetes bacterium]|nr:hypothetical protein [Planctomycetota bacterium]
MKKLSRWMPESSYAHPHLSGAEVSVRQPSIGPVLLLTLALLIDIILAYATYTTPWFALFVGAGVILFFCIGQTLATDQLRRLAMNRTGESISHRCHGTRE